MKLIVLNYSDGDIDLYNNVDDYMDLDFNFKEEEFFSDHCYNDDEVSYMLVPEFKFNTK